jgi:hypothetical protein
VRHDRSVTRDEALAGALSASWSDRAAAATELTHHVDDEVEVAVRRLLADENTAVVEAAAAGLLDRCDLYGVGLFCAAHAEADDHVGDHLNDVLRDAVNTTPEILDLLRMAREEGQRGASEVLQWLGR